MRLNTIVAFAMIGLSLVAAVMVACTDSNPCKPSTLSLQVELGGTANFADTIIITSSDPPLSQSVTRTPNDPNLFKIDVSWPGGYPAGKTVTLLVRAMGGVTLLGENQAVIHLGDTCSTGFVTIRSDTLDAAIVD